MDPITTLLKFGQNNSLGGVQDPWQLLATPQTPQAQMYGGTLLQQAASTQPTSATTTTPTTRLPVSTPPRSGDAISAGIDPNDYLAQRLWEERRQAEIAAEQQRQRDTINSGWDSYISNLNDIGNTYLPQQRDAQSNIANSQYDQGVSQVNAQKVKSLRNITDNIRSAFQAGNNYLGSRGAGDSSAANQYSFAIQQSANKQVGSLDEYVAGQVQNLAYQRDQQINNIGSWFAQAQQQLKQQVAQGGLGRSQDLQNLSQNILNQAIQAVNQVKADSTNRYNALLTWAANNSQNVNQLQQNIAGIPQQFGNPQVNNTLTSFMPVGQDVRRKTDMFGNVIG